MSKVKYNSIVKSIKDLEEPIRKFKCIIITGCLPVQYEDDCGKTKATQEGDCILLPFDSRDRNHDKLRFAYFHLVYIAKAIRGKYRSLAISEKMNEFIDKVFRTIGFYYKDFYEEIVNSGWILYTELPKEEDTEKNQGYFYIGKSTKRQIETVSKILDKMASDNYLCGVDILKSKGEWESIIEKSPEELKKIIEERYLSKDNIERNRR